MTFPCALCAATYNRLDLLLAHATQQHGAR